MPCTDAVFVVHGRNIEARDALFAFLRSISLQPIEWIQAVQATGKPAPMIAEILDKALEQAQAITVLLTGDDEARLSPVLWQPEDPVGEREYTGQARANVLFEAGLALGRCPDRVVFVEIGQVKGFSDNAGRHVVRLNNSLQKRQELAAKLMNAGCRVDLSGTDWHKAGDFSLRSMIPQEPLAALGPVTPASGQSAWAFRPSGSGVVGAVPSQTTDLGAGNDISPDSIQVHQGGGDIGQPRQTGPDRDPDLVQEHGSGPDLFQCHRDLLDDLMTFGSLLVPCVMCEGSGEVAFQQANLRCHSTLDAVVYPEDIKRIIAEVQRAEFALASGFKERAWEGPSFGLTRWHATRSGSNELPVLHLFFKRTSYQEFLATNKSLDELRVHDCNGAQTTLRAKYARAHNCQIPVPQFSNQFGVNISVITSDGFWIAAQRSNHVRLVPDTYQTSVGEATHPSFDTDEYGAPDIFRTAIRGIHEELGMHVEADAVNFYGLIYDPMFCQYDMIGATKIAESAADVRARRSIGTKDGRFETKRLVFVQYTPRNVINFLLGNQPWWPRSVASILYSAIHDFGYQPIVSILSRPKSHLEYRYY